MEVLAGRFGSPGSKFPMGIREITGGMHGGQVGEKKMRFLNGQAGLYRAELAASAKPLLSVSCPSCGHSSLAMPESSIPEEGDRGSEEHVCLS